MIKLYLANQLEDLFEKLLEQINIEEKKKTNPYEPFYILIPNQNIKYWLKQKIAEKQNIIMNYEFYYFEEGIWNLYNKLIKKYNISFDEGLQEERIDPDFLSLIIYQILIEKKDQLKYFNSYLEEHKDYPGNIYNLSSELSEIFFRYNFHNPELVKKLEQQLQEFNLNKEVIENILYDEQLIYSEIQEVINDYNNKNNTNYVLFFKYHNTFQEKINQLKEKIEKPVPLFIFAFQFNNVFYFELLKNLKDIFDIHYFQFILYDYNTPLKFENKAQEISYNNVELFKEITGIEEKEIYFIPLNTKNNKSLLYNLQKTFLTKGINFNNHSINFSEDEPSIKFIEAPDKKTEIKAIIQDIQNSLLINNNLKLNDIAILSPVINEYFPLLRGYLDYLNIPYNIQDPSIKDISYFPDGVRIVCDLIDDFLNNKIPFDKDKVIPVLENPVFQKTHRISQSDIEMFYKFIDSLNIYYENEMDFYHSWEVALKRLRAGKITNESLEYKNNDIKLEVSPYEDFEINFDILEKIHRSLVEFLEDIKILANEFRKNTPILDKYKKFEEIILKHFNVFLYQDSFHIEKKSYYEFIKKLSYLRYFLIEPNDNLLYVYFDMMFDKAKSNIHEYLFNGITISSLQPLRPIPFKRIYILGLNIENFPGKDIKKSFNLIDLFLEENNKYKKNILTRPEENLFLFYEIFFSTRECLILSYKYKDLANKKELYPSYIYNELKEFIVKITNNDKKYVEPIPLTLKLKENKIFNNTFELLNTILATYREDLEYLRKHYKNILNDYDYLKIIFNNNKNSIKEIYKEMKFKPEEIDFKDIDNNMIDINKLLEYLQEPLKYYFDKNQIYRRW
jgi:exodeoxyribonuclease V gamma subunit